MNRDSGTDVANRRWLRRMVRRHLEIISWWLEVGEYWPNWWLDRVRVLTGWPVLVLAACVVILCIVETIKRIVQ